MALIFEWDTKKAIRNREKHGVSFEEAATVFGDPLSLTIDDPIHSTEEERFITMGISIQNRILVVVHTEKQDHIRIISSRVATVHERISYEEGPSES
jgi:hypothetical protein